MLKKLLTGCLTIAMIGAFSASAVAETTFTWTGNVTASYKQTTTKDGTADAKSISISDMAATGDLDLAVVKSGDSWTGTANVEIDATDSDTLKVDDLWVKMSNEQFAILFGDNDMTGVGQGRKYLGEVDDTYGAGGQLMTPGENGWLQLSLLEVGLDLFIGMDRGNYAYAAHKDGAVVVDAASLFDATSDGDYASTAYGLTFKKTFNIVDVGFQYITMGTSIDKNRTADAAAKTAFDGLSASHMSLAVTGNFNEQMALTLNYGSSATTSGASSAKTNTVVTTELAFDMGFSDTMGLSAVYGTYAYDSGVSGKGNKADGTETNVTFKIMTGGVDHFIAYQTRTLKSDAENSKEASEAIVAYSMKVGF